MDLLESEAFSVNPTKFLLGKKTAFILAMATGNRVSEIAAIVRNGIGAISSNSPVRLPIRPGFLYKNQRLGRTPPPIEVHPLVSGPRALCPVRTLKKYLSLTGEVTSGPLFLNSRTNSPVLSSTVSKWICEVIEQADPGKFPRGHDTRRTSTSLAFARGPDPADIAKRAFWRSSSVFIDRYMSAQSGGRCVALNTCSV